MSDPLRQHTVPAPGSVSMGLGCDVGQHRARSSVSSLHVGSEHLTGQPFERGLPAVLDEVDYVHLLR